MRHDVASKTETVYEHTTKTVRCSTHADPEHSTAGDPEPATSHEEAIEAGRPGASARREFTRRSTLAQRNPQIFRMRNSTAYDCQARGVGAPKAPVYSVPVREPNRLRTPARRREGRSEPTLSSNDGSAY